MWISATMSNHRAEWNTVGRLAAKHPSRLYGMHRAAPLGDLPNDDRRYQSSSFGFHKGERRKCYRLANRSSGGHTCKAKLFDL